MRVRSGAGQTVMPYHIFEDFEVSGVVVEWLQNGEYYDSKKDARQEWRAKAPKSSLAPSDIAVDMRPPQSFSLSNAY